MNATTTRRTGARTELARYTVSEGERILYGQRVDGVVRVTDNPAAGHGRAYLVERQLELDGNAALWALIDDYLAECERLNAVPMACSPLELYLEHVMSGGTLEDVQGDRVSARERHEKRATQEIVS